MKKLLTLVAVALFAMGASAQQGSMYIGASDINFWNDGGSVGTGFYYEKKGDNKTTEFGLTPEFGYFLEDNIVLGGVVGFNYWKNDTGVTDSKKTTIRVNPYLRYYAIQEGNFGLYLQGNVNWEYETEAKENTIGVFFNPGVSYAISSKFTATATFGRLGYQYSKADADKDAKNEFGLKLNMSSLNFGLSYTF